MAKCSPWSINQDASDTGTRLKCFSWSTNLTNSKTRTDLSPRWLFRILHRSSRKTSVIPLQEEVSNQIEQGVPKEEYDRVLQEMNSLNDQLSRKDEEINILKSEISERHEEVDLFQPENFQFSSYQSRRTVQIVPIEEYNRVLQERNSLDDQLNQRDDQTAKLKQQISEKDEQLDILKSEVRSLKDDLEWLLTYSDIDPWIRRSIHGNLNNAKDKTREGLKTMEQQSLAVAGPQLANRYREKAGEFDDKDRVKRVERDIIGATPTPTILLSSSGTPTLLFSRSETPPKAATPTTMDRLPTSYYSHAEIFHTLMQKGIIAPPFPWMPHDESRPIHRPNYHNGSRGHSAENMRLPADNSSDKFKPPEGVVQDNSYADKLTCLDENAASSR